MLFPLASATVIILACSTKGYAQDGFSGPFNGPYGGVYLGYAEYDVGLADAPIFDGASIDITGAEYGIYGGYGRSFDSFYIAGEAEFGRGPDLTSFAGIDDLDLDIEQTYGVSVLVGYLVAFDTVVYARLGYQGAQVRDEIVDRDEDLDGARYGAGVDHAFNDNIRLRGEFVFTEFEKEDFSGFNLEFRQNLFRFGLAYEF